MRQIASLGNPELFQDSAVGPALKISIRFTEGPDEQWAIPVGELGDLLGYFTMLNQTLTEQGFVVTKTNQTPMVGPITVHGAGLSLGTPGHHSEVLLMLDLAGCRLGFQFPQGAMAELGEKMRHSALAASADEKRKN